MRRIWLLMLLLLPAVVQAQAPMGPHPVGFRVVEHWDRTRVATPAVDFRGKATGAPQATPMLVGVWYPAEATTRAPMKVVEYSELQQRRVTLGPPQPGDREAAAAGLKGMAQIGLGLTLDDAAIEAALQQATHAVRDAPPAAGRFPLILGGMEGPATAAPLAELLASHGYVVLSSPSLPAVAGQQVNAQQVALETQTRNIETLRALAFALPNVDTTRLGVVGINFDGLAALNYQMRNMDGRAVVSLDGYEGKTFGQEILTGSEYYDARRMRVPYLLFVQANAPQPRFGADPSVLNLLPFSERRVRVVKDLAHVHYVGSIWSLDAIAPAIRQARASVEATVLDFLDAHVRGDAGALQQFTQHTPPAMLELDSARAALPAAPTSEEFETLVMSGDTAELRAVIGTLERADSSVVLFTQSEMNLYAFRFTQRGERGIALVLRELSAQHHPTSARAAYAYADALALALAIAAVGPNPELAGRTRAALERAAALVDTDSTVNDADRAALRTAIAERLAALPR